MDAITREALTRLAARHPGCAIVLTHQFLDGVQGKSCGLVPPMRSGETVRIAGPWWTVQRNFSQPDLKE